MKQCNIPTKYVRGNYVFIRFRIPRKVVLFLPLLISNLFIQILGKILDEVVTQNQFCEPNDPCKQVYTLPNHNTDQFPS